jgi:phosphatidylinositol 3-kinase
MAKFIKVVNWNVASEAMLALDLIAKWAPMDVEDALELLGPSFKHPGVRQYAVNRLQKSPDTDLQMYLLQLVQVRYLKRKLCFNN